MAEPLLSVVIDGIIMILGSQLAAQEIGLLWGVEDDLRRLTIAVSTIKAVLQDVEEKRAGGSLAVKGWLENLNDAIYDADDLLDAVSTVAMRREIMTRDKKAKRVRIFFFFHLLLLLLFN
jgi:hypothetical protein